MNFIKEWLPIIISSLALLASIWNFIKNRKIAQAQVELQIHTKISDAKKELNKFIYETNKENKQIEKQLLQTLLESELNTYEEACNKYLDNKIDKKRFRKSYIDEIRRLFESESTKDKVKDDSSKYNAIRKVHNEWHNHEK